MRNNVKLLSVLLIITCAACGQVPQPFQKTKLQKAKDTKLLAPSSRSLFVKGINGPVGWVGNAFAKATAHILRGKGLLAVQRGSLINPSLLQQTVINNSMKIDLQI